MADRHARTPDHDDVVAVLKELIAIDSSNPDLVPGSAGESAIADHVTGWLTARGFTCERLESRPGRPSVLATARGTGGGRSLMLNGHLDTVSLASYDGDALEPRLEGNALHGRGAYDMKSGIAAMMVAAAAAVRHGDRRGDLVLALVADEEYASAGTEEVLRHRTTDSAIVLEPSGLDVVVAHRGFVWAEVAIHGRAAHGSRPDLGVDAIAKTGRFLTGLDELGARLGSGPRHPLLGTGNVHASLISGGVEASSYPAECRVTIERRTLPGEDGAQVERELRAILDVVTASETDLAYDVSITFERPAFATDPDSPIVRDLVEAAKASTGETPVLRGEAFWTDCALLADGGISTVLFGVDGGGAHAAQEWVDLDSLVAVTRTLERTIVVHTT